MQHDSMHATMATFTDLPMFVLPFIVLAQCATLSRWCKHATEEAIKAKDRGMSMVKYMATVRHERRFDKMAKHVSPCDKWAMWNYLAKMVHGGNTTTLYFLKAAPYTFWVSSEYTHPLLHITTSAQNAIGVPVPYSLLTNPLTIVQTSLTDAVRVVQNSIQLLIGADNIKYDTLEWQTCPLTFYMLDLERRNVLMFGSTVITCNNGVVEHIPYSVHRSTDIEDVHNHLGVFVDYL